MTRRELSRILRWRRPSSSLLVLLTRDARHRAPLTTGKAWGHPAFCGYGRVQARDINAAARLHTQTTARIYGFWPRSGRFRIKQKKCGRQTIGAERTIGLGRWPKFQPLAQARRKVTPATEGSADVGSAFGDTPHRVEEDVDLLVGVVEGERRTH